jgi:aminomethyltransferase
MIISNSGYTGAGFELTSSTSMHPRYGRGCLNMVRSFDSHRLALLARHLRLEMGFLPYGTTSMIPPLPSRLTGLDHQPRGGHDFINRRALEIEKSGGVHRKLVGFEMKERAIPRQHYPILDGEGNPLGEVTTGTMSPMTGIGIGMGYVRTDRAATGSEIFIGIRNKLVPAVVVRPPFSSLTSTR